MAIKTGPAWRLIIRLKGVPMKKPLFLILAIFAAGALYADEIILKDGTVLKGAVIQVTDGAVEYDPEGPSAFDTVSKDRISKIIYTGGKEQHFQLDTIILTGGDAIRCSISRVTKETIFYRQDGAGEEKSISRDQVSRLEFSDGRSVDIFKKTAPEETADTAKKPIGGYHTSIFRMSIFGGGGMMDGGIVKKERGVFRAYKPDLMMATLHTPGYSQYGTFATGGAEAELMAPAIRFAQKRGFDFTGLKFGVRGRYGYEEGMSVITPEYRHGFDGINDDNVFMGRLLQYHYWTAGPTMNFIFSPRSNVVNFMISVYGTAGQVFGGRLNPMTALRDSNLLTARLVGLWSAGNVAPFMSGVNILTLSALNKTTVKGYTIRCGIGPEVSLNKWFPLVVGFHLTYAYTSLTFGKAPLIYGGTTTKAAHHEVGGEVSVGIHI